LFPSFSPLWGIKTPLSNVLATVYKRGIRETSRKRQGNVKKGIFEEEKKKKATK
jgi:hypothetical protein